MPLTDEQQAYVSRYWADAIREHATEECHRFCTYCLCRQQFGSDAGPLPIVAEIVKNGYLPDAKWATIVAGPVWYPQPTNESGFGRFPYALKSGDRWIRVADGMGVTL